MKFQAWVLLFSCLLWTVSPFGALQPAFGDTPQLNGSQNTTKIDSPKINTPPPPPPNFTQQKAQQDTRDMNKQGQKQSQMLGMLAIAGGTALVAKGMALNSSPCGCGAPLIIAGVFMIMQGTLGLKAAAQMGGNAGTAQGFNVGLTTITDPPLDSTKINDGSGESGIRIDDSFLRNDKAKSIMADLEKNTGISADEFMKGFKDGKSIPEMLAETGKFGSAEKIAGAMEGAAGEAGAHGGNVMDELGLTEADLAAMAAEGDGKGTEEDVYALGAGGGAGGGKNGTGASSSGDLASLLGGAGKGANGNGATAGGVGGAGDYKLSDDVQAALDQNGITGRSLFEMVSSQYKKKTPMMFGVTQKKLSTTEENPFANLTGAGLEL